MRQLSLCRQTGVALITVLLVIAMVTVLATRMSGHLQVQIARVGASDSAEQAYWHWLSAEALVRQVLLAEHEESEGRTHLQQGWATQQGPFPVRGGMIGGKVRDLHACFNVNSLLKNPNETAKFSESVERFQALLNALEFDEYTARLLTATLVDWLDADDDLHESMGAESADYESLPQPYQAANQSLAHISELRQIRGFNAEVYHRLRPYVCVIPELNEWPLNLNTVAADQPEIIVAFFRGAVDMTAAENLLADRPSDGWESVDAIRQEPTFQALAEGGTNTFSMDGITVSSEYFELNAQVQYGDLEFYGTSQIRIAGGRGYILHRSRGGYEYDERTVDN
ncbi:type II secretion system minor pseudopilin GspK [Aliidiomarina celeris]|uniref:type II secretion system minor pseudopilin GspK n=1 Tax=Aliidiomarina celeris TaxID=2249428 RepID=UPI000DEB8D12|nr:type II secretion system minor pseudopilin GspK [Aliidiomarina celeris]